MASGVKYEMKRGGEVKAVYLKTRTYGEKGREIAQRVKLCQDLGFALNKDMRRQEILSSRVDAMLSRNALMDEIDAAQDKVDALSQQIMDVTNRLNDKFAELVACSLAMNYGEEANSIMDQVSTADLHKMAQVIIDGQEPEVFFQSPGEPMKSTLTPSADGNSDTSCLKVDSPHGKSITATSPEMTPNS